MTEELEYEKQLGLKDMEIKGKEVRIAELEESNKEWQRTCEAKSYTNSQLTEQLADKAEKIADLEDKLANADYQLEGRDNEIRELKESNKELQKELDYQKQARSIAENAVVKLSRKNAEAKEIIRDLLKLDNDKFGQTKMDWRISVVEKAEVFLKED